MRKTILWVIGTLIFAIVAIVVIFNISPNPTISLAKAILFKTPSDDREKEYTDGSVRVKVGLTYSSQYKNNQFDLYTPSEQLEGKPTIAWVHGGGFIGGDKLEEKEYASKLADLGYTVAVMNYELVPETDYPQPVIQTSEFIKFLTGHSKEYSLNMDNLFIAGDSAGAQIASQFIATQTNKEYRESLHIAKVLNPTQIRGALLYCGPYNMPEIVGESASPLVKFAFGGIGWGYFKDKNWSKSDQAKSSIVGNFITKDFPASYITDGNTASFESQGKELITKLEAEDVQVTQRFFEISEYKTAHEYQFDTNSEAGQVAFKDTTGFLKKYRNIK